MSLKKLFRVERTADVKSMEFVLFKRIIKKFHEPESRNQMLKEQWGKQTQNEKRNSTFIILNNLKKTMPLKYVI